MNDITPSDSQALAIAELKDWFENRTREQQVFRLFGYAGSGKSTVLKFALDELGLEPHRGDRDGGQCVPGVVTATFTPVRRPWCCGARARPPAPFTA